MSDFNYQWYLEKERRTNFLAEDSRQPCPEDLFRAGLRKPIVAAFLANWRQGNCSWEKMLIALALELLQREEHFVKAATQRAQTDCLKAVSIPEQG